jgi:hypothetical protein
MPASRSRFAEQARPRKANNMTLIFRSYENGASTDPLPVLAALFLFSDLNATAMLIHIKPVAGGCACLGRRRSEAICGISFIPGGR